MRLHAIVCAPYQRPIKAPTETCPQCRGTGITWLFRNACPECHGWGRVALPYRGSTR